MPNQNNTQWTPALEARLRELHANGDSFSVIAGDLKMTRSMVAGKCKRLGLTFVPRQERRELVQRREPRPLRIVVPPVEPLRLLFGELRHDSCRWVPNATGAATFCGHPTERGSYCAYHGQLVYRMAA